MSMVTPPNKSLWAREQFSPETRQLECSPCSPKTHAAAWRYFGEDQTDANAATGTALTAGMLWQKSLAEVKALCRCAGLTVTAKKEVLIRALVDPSAPIRLRRHVPVRKPDRQLTYECRAPPTASEVDEALAGAGIRDASPCLRSALLRGHCSVPGLRDGRLEPALVLYSAVCPGCEEREITLTVLDVAGDDENAHASCGCGAALFLDGLCEGEPEFAWHPCSRAHGLDRQLEVEEDNRQPVTAAGGPHELGVPFLYAVTKVPPEWSPMLSPVDDDESPPGFFETVCAIPSTEDASAEERSSLAEPASPAVLVPASPLPADATASLLSPPASGGTDVMRPLSPPLSPVASHRWKAAIPALTAIAADEPLPFSYSRSLRHANGGKRSAAADIAPPVQEVETICPPLVVVDEVETICPPLVVVDRREGGARSPALSAIAAGDFAALFAPLPSRPSPKQPVLLPFSASAEPRRARRSTAGKQKRSAFNNSTSKPAAAATPRALPKRQKTSAWDRLLALPALPLGQ